MKYCKSRIVTFYHNYAVKHSLENIAKISRFKLDFPIGNFRPKLTQNCHFLGCHILTGIVRFLSDFNYLSCRGGALSKWTMQFLKAKKSKNVDLSIFLSGVKLICFSRQKALKQFFCQIGSPNRVGRATRNKLFLNGALIR